MPETRNSKVLASFVAYCKANPSQRFWQALRNWSKFDGIFGRKYDAAGLRFNEIDTFYFEGKDE